MKNVMNTQTGIYWTKLVTIGLVTAWTSLVVAKGNGGGYGGPDLTGYSIPVQLERGITLEEAGEAINVCLYKGDQATGRISLLQRFAEQTYGVKNVELNRLPSPDPSVFNVSKDSIYFQIQVNGPGFGLTVANDRDESGSGIKFPQGYMVINFTHPTNKNAAYLMSGVSAYPLPAISFSEQIQDVVYDKWGHSTKGPIILKGVSIKVWSTSAIEELYTVYHVRNRMPVTVNTAEYAECLQAELQKYAN